MNTTTTTIELRGCPTCEGPAQAIAEGEGVRYRHVDLRQATNTRGVSEAMVDGPALLQIARNVGLREVMFNVSAERATPLLQAFFAAALEAALSAEPAAQGEEGFDARKYVRHMADVLEAGGDLFKVDADLLRLAAAINKAANTAPPAQPAERVPDGWVLVPREPTEEMLVAGLKEADPIGELVDWKAGVSDVADPATRDDLSAIYAAMLTASPAPSDGGKGVDVSELRRAVAAIRVVGQRDSYDLIRRESVLDIIDQRLTAAQQAAR